MESVERIRVLHVAGWAYSGTTLLANVAGRTSGTFAAGETRLVWERGFLQDSLCGCGSRFSTCPVWTAVVERAFGGPAGIDAERMAVFATRLLRNRRAPWFLAGRPSGLFLRKEFGEYAAAVTALYEALRAVTDCRVIVDTSKPPLYNVFLAALPAVDLWTVQLVRDPRGYLHSLRSRGYGPRPTLALALWTLNHAVAEVAGRTRRPERHVVLRYEDFARFPVSVARALSDLTDGSSSPKLVKTRRMVLPGNHMVAGNPSRLTSGIVEITLDEQWRDALPRRTRALAIGMTWPLLIRHGYLGHKWKSEDALEGLLGFANHSRQREL